MRFALAASPFTQGARPVSGNPARPVGNHFISTDKFPYNRPSFVWE